MKPDYFVKKAKVQVFNVSLSSGMVLAPNWKDNRCLVPIAASLAVGELKYNQDPSVRKSRADILHLSN